MREVQRMADRVCTLILSSDLPSIDIEIEKNKVRERCLELYPDREQLYEMVYGNKFQRLWEQFRSEPDLPGSCCPSGSDPPYDAQQDANAESLPHFRSFCLPSRPTHGLSG